jgi:thioesterase domain-containing protein
MEASAGPSAPSPPRDPRLFPLRASGTRPPLFLVAAPGVNALGYTGLARGLAADQPVYVVQPQGKDLTFAPLGAGTRGAFMAVAAGYVEAIRTVGGEGPYVLGGTGHGANIAFQMARLLEAAGDRVALLAIVETFPLEDMPVHARLLANVAARRWQRASRAELWAELRRRAAGALDELRAPGSGRWPGEGWVSPILRAPIAVLLADARSVRGDDALGWRAHTSGEVVVRTVACGREDLLRKPHVRSLARALEDVLAPTRSTSASTGPGVAGFMGRR